MSVAYSHSTIQCLTVIAQHHGIQALPERLIHEYALPASEPDNRLVQRIAGDIGLKAKAIRSDWARLTQLQGVFPVLVRRTDGHSMIVAGVEKDPASASVRVAVLDPQDKSGKVRPMTEAEFTAQWSGTLVLLKREYKLLDIDQPFGLRWFIPEIFRQRKAFRDIAITAIMLQLLGLGMPIFSQIIIDKVLVHESYSTLIVLTVAIVGVVLFEAAFSFMRQYLLLHASNVIDIRLSRRTFSHLLSLPIDYFETHTAGVIARHMQQVQSIRNFLTGRLFFTALDALGLILFIPLLASYSTKLALIVLGFSALMAMVVLLLIKPFNTRLQALYNAEGIRQSMLVETIHGMRTVKSLAIEPKQRKVWDQRTATTIQMHFGVGKMSIAAASVTQILEKLMMVTVIAVGAMDVFSLELTVGALIAFQMMSNRVVGPLVQIVGLVHEYQETALSVKMLGEVMNLPPERKSSGGLRPVFKGQIGLDGVTFRYPSTAATALDRVSMNIEAGTVVGVVGRSGSGKTTFTRLIQGLYPVQEGVIRFDGVDIREIDLAHLRRSIGVVLQDNFMFRGSVRENIAMARPDASFELVVAAAQAAGADEFIERLPQGYDTILEENAANLSGGQRQRLAIARALLPSPRILILDEAASALDPESEAIFIRNLGRIAAGRTVIIVSHRLSTLVNANQIFVFDRGRLSDAGRHNELLGRCEPYTHLWNQQTSFL
ncbi:MAG: peptidase domain-containing ABC transporter [Burkholderiaceae bacterium]|nr:peptidase domain-containing ABC transporter [Burkholderiaceae bacterium]